MCIRDRSTGRGEQGKPDLCDDFQKSERELLWRIQQASERRRNRCMDRYLIWGYGMETSGQPKYDSTSMGGGKMKQLKITKRQAALMLLELCHGFLILFAIYACAVVISGHGSEPFVLVGCLLFPLNAGLFLAEKKATHFWQFGIVTLLLIGGSVMLLSLIHISGSYRCWC